MKKYRIGFIVLLSFCIYPFMGSMAQNGIASSDVGMRFWRQGQYEKAAKVFQKRSKFSLRDAFLLKDCYTDWVLNSVNMNSEAEKYMSDAEFNISMLTDGKEKSAEDIISLIDFGNSLAASKDADDRAAAYTYFREAAHYDNTGVAQYFLGCLYYNGSAPVSSEALAYFWFTESSKMGFPNGTHMLGVCWRDGVYVSENKRRL